MKKIILLVVLSVISINVQAQFTSKKKSTAPGTLFFYWGYNRSIYTPSTIRFIGPGYDFQLKGVEAVDRPSTNLNEYINFNSFTVPQFDVRVGYNFKRNWLFLLVMST